ncbi:unnamed protein product [Blepharisma stoltei]|uniref:Importin N-terminal domain-containing protein n=1 Tax=Blepharisma stoltei TaxID=1481888 RepID=A0AAU9IPE2_9CILI|nr:unnamed protein product [Blepharisma stoltei]
MSEAFGRAAQLLTQTYSSISDTERKQAEEELRILSQDTKGFFQFLLTVISSQDSPHQLKQSAGTRLRNFMRECIESSKLAAEDRMYLAEMIFQTIISPNIDRSIRGITNYALNPLISDDAMGLCCNRLAALAIVGLKGEAHQVFGSLSVIKTIFSCMPSQFNAGDYSKILLPHMIDVGNKVFFQLGAALQSSNEALAIEILYIFEEWSLSLRQILEHFEVVSNKGIKEFVEHTEIASIFTNTINIRIPDFRLPNVNAVINLSSGTVTNLMNQIKANIIKCLNIVIQYFMDCKKKIYEEMGAKVISTIGAAIPDSPFVDSVNAVLEPLIISLLAICVHPDVDQFIIQSWLSEIVIETLNLLHKCSSESRFYGIFGQFYKQIITDIILQFLRLNESDKELFDTQPDEFVNICQDICERQESETVKTVSAQLLETMCDNIDGALPFSAYFAFELIESIINPEINKEYPLIKELANTVFMASDNENKVATAFMMLSILSFGISRRSDLLNGINNLLEKIMTAFFSTSSSMIIHQRVCQFLYCFSEHIFQDKLEYFKRWMLYILDCILQQSSRAVCIQACDTFSYIMQEDELMFRLEPFMGEVVDKVIEAIPNQKEKSFYEALVEIVQNFGESLDRKVVPLMIALVGKIQSEVQCQIANNKKDSIIVIKSWNIIRSLINSISVSGADLEELEKLLLPIINYIQYPDQVSFFDDIISIIQLIQKKAKSISALQWEIFNHLPVLQAKQENTLQIVFKLLNTYLRFGKDSFATSPQRMAQVVEMAGKALFAQPKGRIREGLNCEGAILYHLLFQTFPGQLDQYMDKILTDTFMRYAQSTTNNFFKVRLLDTILSSFTYNATLTANILSATQTAEGISYLRFSLLEIIKMANQFTHQYDKRVAVIGLCHLFMMPQMNNDIYELIDKIFDTVIVILSYKKPTEEETKQKSPIDMLMENLFDSDEDSFDSEIFVKGTKLIYGGSGEDAPGEREEKEANSILVNLFSPIFVVDEYNVFRTMVSQLHATNKDFMVNLTRNLSPVRGQQLVEIVQSKRIQINDLPGENTEIRRVVKAARRK